MARQFIQRHNGTTPTRSTNRFAGENRDEVAKSNNRDMRRRRQRLLEEAVMLSAFDGTDEPLDTVCSITDEEPTGASTKTRSDDGGLDVTILYSPTGAVQAALCRPVRS